MINQGFRSELETIWPTVYMSSSLINAWIAEVRKTEYTGNQQSCKNQKDPFVEVVAMRFLVLMYRFRDHKRRAFSNHGFFGLCLL